MLNTKPALKSHIYRNTGSAKTVCATTVLCALGISIEKFHSTSTKKNIDNYESVIRRHGFALRSRKSKIKSTSSVGSIRTKLNQFGDPQNTVYLVRLKNHVLLLDSNGKTIVDTDPRVKDKRKICKLHAIWKK
jgi:hypothetical protein